MRRITITIREQEFDDVGYDFNIQMVITPNLKSELERIGNLSEIIILSHLSILEKYKDSNIDYLQVLECDGLEFWCISNKRLDEDYDSRVHCVTWLLPSDY